MWREREIEGREGGREREREREREKENATKPKALCGYAAASFTERVLLCDCLLRVTRGDELNSRAYREAYSLRDF
jgi:hypothetical protein